MLERKFLSDIIQPLIQALVDPPGTLKLDQRLLYLYPRSADEILFL